MEQKTNHLKPYVTLEQAYNYDASRPETRTPSPLVDAVMEAIRTLKPMNPKKFKEYLGIPTTKISSALEIIMGLSLQQLREELAKHEIALHPEKSLEAVALEFGFANRSSLWKALHREIRKQEYAELKERLERSSRLSPEEQEAEHQRIMNLIREERKRYKIN